MKAPLTFNSAQLTGHTIIIIIFLESMQDTTCKNKIILFGRTVIEISILKSGPL